MCCSFYTIHLSWIKTESLHLKHTVIVSFQAHCGGVQSQNEENCVNVQIYMDLYNGKAYKQQITAIPWVKVREASQKGIDCPHSNMYGQQVMLYLHICTGKHWNVMEQQVKCDGNVIYSLIHSRLKL